MHGCHEDPKFRVNKWLGPALAGYGSFFSPRNLLKINNSLHQLKKKKSLWEKMINTLNIINKLVSTPASDCKNERKS